jgi:DNA-binding NtrC family response regulator
MNQSIDILIHGLDDNKHEVELLHRFLLKENILNYKLFTSKEKFFEEFNKKVQMAIIDLNLGNSIIEGMDVLCKIKDLNKNCHTIAMSGFYNPDDVIELGRCGTKDFVNKNKSNYLTDLLNIITREAPRLKAKFEFLNEFKQQQI